MIKLIYGTDKTIIDNYLSDMFASYNITNPLKANNLNEIIDNYNQISIFSFTHNYIVYDCDIFCNLEEFKKNENLIEQIIDNNELNVFITCNKKISQARTIKNILDKIEIHLTDSINEKTLPIYINSWLEKHQLNVYCGVVDLLCTKLTPNASIINSELSKLLWFEKIDENLVNELVCDWKYADIFGLCESIINKDYAKTINLYHKLISQNHDIVELLQILAAQLLGLYMQKILLKNKYDKNVICDSLNLHPYVFTKNTITLARIDTQFLKSICDKLFTIDMKIKQGLIDKSHAFKYFLLEL